MEAAKSLSSLFSHTPDTIQYSRRAHVMQRQLREKEEQLQHQLVLISQRQRDARKRNQDLLRDFKRIEDKLSHLAARSDSFRRKQGEYKEQMYNFSSTESNCVAPEATSINGHRNNKRLNAPLTSNESSVGEPCHFLTSMGRAVQASAHFKLCPNQPLILQGCCNHLPCCMANRKCDKQFGIFLPDARDKVCRCELDFEPQTENFSLRDKKNISIHRSEFLCGDNSAESGPSRHTFQGLCSHDNDAMRDTNLKPDAQRKQTKKKSRTSVLKTHKEKDKIAVFQAEKSVTNSSVAAAARDDEHVNMATIQQDNTEIILYEERIGNPKSRENIDDVHFLNKCRSASDSLTGVEVDDETNGYKSVENNDTCKVAIQSIEEMTIIDSSAEKSIDEQAVAYPKDLCPAVKSEKYKHKKGRGITSSVIKQSSEELTSFDKENNGLIKESRTTKEQEPLENDDSNEVETSVSSDFSIKEKESMASSNTSSESENSFEIKDTSLQREVFTQCQGWRASKDCITDTDKMKEILDMDISEQESQPSTKSKHQIQEDRDSRNVGMLEEDIQRARNSNENKIINDIDGGVVKSESQQKMSIVEKDINSRNKVSERSESQGQKMVGIVMVKGNKAEDEISINEESNSEQNSAGYKTSDDDEEEANDEHKDDENYKKTGREENSAGYKTSDDDEEANDEHEDDENYKKIGSEQNSAGYKTSDDDEEEANDEHEDEENYKKTRSEENSAGYKTSDDDEEEANDEDEDEENYKKTGSEENSAGYKTSDDDEEEANDEHEDEENYKKTRSEENSAGYNTSDDDEEDEDEEEEFDDEGSHAIDILAYEDANEEKIHTEINKETKVTKKMLDTNMSDTSQVLEMIGGKEMADKCDMSDKSGSLCKFLDDSDVIDSLDEEEENTNFCGSKREGNNSDSEDMEKDEDVQKPVDDNIFSNSNQEASAREEKNIHQKETAVEKVVKRSQDLEWAEEDLDKQRSLWCCCSLFRVCIKSEQRAMDNRRGAEEEDGDLDLLQLHPVESGSSLTPQKTSISRISRTTSNSEREGSRKESIHSDKDDENQNLLCSDSDSEAGSDFSD